MTKDEAVNAIDALLHTCRQGDFYREHDESWEMLVAAERGLEVLNGKG